MSNQKKGKESNDKKVAASTLKEKRAVKAEKKKEKSRSGDD